MSDFAVIHTYRKDIPQDTSVIPLDDKQLILYTWAKTIEKGGGPVWVKSNGKKTIVAFIRDEAEEYVDAVNNYLGGRSESLPWEYGCYMKAEAGWRFLMSLTSKHEDRQKNYY